MKYKLIIFKELSWLDNLILLGISFFATTFDLLSVHFTPTKEVKLHIPSLYGFPLPNKTNISWGADGERTLYITPYFIDLFVYFIILSVVYWFIFKYLFPTQLRKRFFIPLFFGLIFASFYPFIMPEHVYSFNLVEYPSDWYDWHINWFGNRR
jgi:hypothetical protein